MSDKSETSGNYIKSFQMRWPESRDELLAYTGVGQEKNDFMVDLEPCDVDAAIGKAPLANYYIIEGTAEYCLEQVKDLEPAMPDSLIEIETTNDFDFDMRTKMNEVWEDHAAIQGVKLGKDGFSNWKRVEIICGAEAVRADCPVLLTRDHVLTSKKNTYSDLRFLDCGGTSICYRGETDEGDSVLIKEVYPMSIGSWLIRDREGRLISSDSSDTAKQAARYRLRQYVEKGIAEKKLEGELVKKGFKFFEPNYDWFLENNTIYTVYRDYGAGTLAQMAGNISAIDAVGLTRRILEPLKELHRTGYLHLDISPENILLGPEADGVPTFKFIDLGSLVKKDEISQMTQFPCKDGFSPFELFSAAASSEARELISEATDTFSVGAVLYNLLTGKTVSWSVCRCRGGKIINEDNTGVQLSESMCVTVNGDNIHGEAVNTLSPRVLEALNAFLSTALKNNPSKRFRTADEMDAMAAKLIKYMKDGQCYFARMDMPDNFLKDIIEEERMKFGKLTKKYNDYARETYSPEIIRETIKSGRSVVIDDIPMEAAKAVVSEYLDKYGKNYNEIIFSDEVNNYGCPLFSGDISGAHDETKRIDYDKNTLIVRAVGSGYNVSDDFYNNMGDPEIRGGVAAMQYDDGKSAASFSFVLKSDVKPAYIYISPAIVGKFGRAKMADSISRYLMPIFPFVLGIVMLIKMSSNSFLMRRILDLKDFYFHGKVYNGGPSYEIDNLIRSIGNSKMLGPSEGPPPILLKEGSEANLLPLWLTQNYGWLTGLLFSISILALVFFLGKKTRKTLAGTAAYNMLLGRVLVFVCSSWGLWLGYPTKLFFSRYTYYILIVMAAAEYIRYKKKGCGKRYIGAEGFKSFVCALVYIVSVCTLRGLYHGPLFVYGVTFAILCLMDISMGIIVNFFKLYGDDYWFTMIDFDIKPRLEKIKKMFAKFDPEEGDEDWIPDPEPEGRNESRETEEEYEENRDRNAGVRK